MLTSNYAQDINTSSTQAEDSLSVEDQENTNTQESDLDYDALVKELYGDPESKSEEPKVIESEVIEEGRKRTPVKGLAPGKFANSRLNGIHISVNAASPYAVANQLLSWYSYIDAGVSIKLPYEILVENIPLYPLFEVSTFNFENSYPSGGSFTGLAYIGQVSAIGDQAAAVLGFGFWDGNLGSMMEANYRFRPTTNTFFRLGTRGVLMTNVEPLGEVWWLEFRLSMGIEL